MTQEYQKVVKILHDANEHIQYPRIELNNNFTLQLAGANSKYPKSVNITDGKPFGSNKWYGRLSTGGTLFMPNHMQPFGEALQTELGLFQLDPAKYATAYGKELGNCMFCRKNLSNQQSVAVGYGPICADHYGLPWGDLDPEEAKRQSSFKFKLPAAEQPCVTHVATATNTQACTETVTADKFAIGLLRDVAIVQLSELAQGALDDQIERNPQDEYMFLVTALWEAL